jgi:Xaa-Pro aminopeptidase
MSEIIAIKQAHLWDGIALTKFLYWLSENATTGITEMQAAQKLEDYRRVNKELKDLSFDTIAGFGSNGAIIHYRVTEKTNKRLEKGSLFLLDSGGQYLQGTTDVTRTIAIGTPNDEMKINFTRVLKGHIRLAMAKFPENTTGAMLDVLARYSLWQAGLDYNHGTGHGVGCYLSVHEGPQNISLRSKTPLKEGMILSNEPGYYKEGDYGIRIENLMLVTPPTMVLNAEKAMMGFETLTLAPIDKNLIMLDMLDKDEKDWLNYYHQTVYTALQPYMSLFEDAWLKAATQAI